MTGELLDGRYLIQERLGSGAFGAVHRAEHHVFGVPLRSVAVKFLNPGPDGGAPVDAIVREVLRVTRVIEQCPDPYVRDRFLTCYDAGGDDRPFLVMELGRGDLAWRTRGAQHAVEQARDLLREICAGMEFLHGRGIVHLDLKPANVVVSGSGALKIGDFGSAVRIGDLAGDAPGGTLAYQAPEILAGASPTPAADVYALGMIAYELLAGRLPRQERLLALAGDGDAVPPRTAELIELKRDDVPRPGAVNPAVAGHPFEEVVLRALDPLVSRRFTDAGELLRALDTTIVPAPPATGPALVRELTDRLVDARSRGGATLDRDVTTRAVAQAEAANDALPDDQVVTAFYPVAVDLLVGSGEVVESRRVARAGLARRRCRDTVCAMAAAYAGTPVGRAFGRECGATRS